MTTPDAPSASTIACRSRCVEGAYLGPPAETSRGIYEVRLRALVLGLVLGHEGMSRRRRNPAREGPGRGCEHGAFCGTSALTRMVEPSRRCRTGEEGCTVRPARRAGAGFRRGRARWLRCSGALAPERGRPGPAFESLSSGTLRYSAAVKRRIVAIGGGSTGEPLRDYVLTLSGRRRPRLLWVNTGMSEEPRSTLRGYDFFARRADVSILEFFPWPPQDLREFVLGHDIVFVGGGNPANMLAVWRVHGFDAIVREAWDQGRVLAGSSGGMHGWFEACVTDSFGPQLEGMRDGLGFLPGSACAHFDNEEFDRPVDP